VVNIIPYSLLNQKCIYLELLWLFQFQFPTFVTFTFFKEVKKSERHKMRNKERTGFS